ncbi:DNA cytosine methyltransferase [Amycolatopsis tucumanensis]|uniref:Cytosine-specific methyltransferase n=1 Tax=Amycolatopsis tucumanensis TaxID=401106 RepID=A0ABP7JQM9_9PSEU|nr:DNA (cytosine-5-)-methyltransferase [Amycolatopsis tucumanensis]MCF6425005.1 DNA (cytosine-5-)-methyltransferase [Amycolatopsis tucumanensis]
MPADPTTQARGGSDGLRFVATEGPVIGSLCTGVGGLDLGVAAVLGGRIAWYSEVDPHACAVLAARVPGAPNLGDLRAVDFTAVEPVEVLTAGFPCQDISAAGRRAGIEKGTRSGLWYTILDAIRVLGPRLVVVENVAALRWRNGGLDRVLAGLAETGYDAVWRCVRASDIGAAHRRERVFLCAVPQPERHPDDADPAGARRRAPRSRRPGPPTRGRAPGQSQRRGGLGSQSGPAAADTDGRGLAVGRYPDRAETGTPDPSRMRDADRLSTAIAHTNCVRRQELYTRNTLRRAVAARPRPYSHEPATHGPRNRLRSIKNRGGGGFVDVSPRARGRALLPTPTAHDGSSNGISAKSRQGGASLLETLRLLPTPRATDGTKGCPAQRGSKGDLMLPSVVIAVTRIPQAQAPGGGNHDRAHTSRPPRRTS